MPDLDEARRALLRVALTDPGSVVPRRHESAGEHAREPAADWQLRAVEALIRPWLAGDPEDGDVARFQALVDEDGDLSLACPSVADVGCFFAAGFLPGTTLGEMARAARRHTGAVASETHASILAVNGEAPPAQETCAVVHLPGPRRAGIRP
jgi:hypothetical protein